ncbi:hypothetical protein HM1_0507 [Heliomicrobium modesticaldum Ice1]|uniref:Uncharacterized protein n=1 Tax=Heliobacterium modesticaldum (strain ATCC 51547 / Ice1) TaxID=498761 RepID=B0TFM2_HELMI|nr:hypothetical protein HM1_0507 [Heliomicrobium modesticaldum Ice1]
MPSMRTIDGKTSESPLIGRVNPGSREMNERDEIRRMNMKDDYEGRKKIGRFFL